MISLFGGTILKAMSPGWQSSLEISLQKLYLLISSLFLLSGPEDSVIFPLQWTEVSEIVNGNKLFLLYYLEFFYYTAQIPEKNNVRIEEFYFGPKFVITVGKSWQ